MNFVDKLGEGICASIDMIIDKNRPLAQLNRLSTIIRTETEIINNAYIALGKQYRHVLEGGEAAEDMSRVVEVLAYSEKRLKINCFDCNTIRFSVRKFIKKAS